MSTAISDRIPVLPKVSTTSQSPGFVERPTVADLLPEGTEAALRSRLGFGASPEYVTTSEGKEAFWADLGRPQARIVPAHDAEAFWEDLGRPQTPEKNTLDGRVERVTSAADRSLRRGPRASRWLRDRASRRRKGDGPRRRGSVLAGHLALTSVGPLPTLLREA